MRKKIDMLIPAAALLLLAGCGSSDDGVGYVGSADVTPMILTSPALSMPTASEKPVESA